MNDDELTIVNEAAAAAVEAAMRRNPGWRMIPGKVQAFDPDTFMASVLVDGTDGPLSAYIAVGVPVRPGDRVLVTFTNPGGAFITGFVGLARAVVGELSVNSIVVPPGQIRYPNFWEASDMTFPDDWDWSTSSPWMAATWPGWYYVYYSGRGGGNGYIDVAFSVSGTNGRDYFIANATVSGITNIRAAALVYIPAGSRFRFKYQSLGASQADVTMTSADFQLAYLGSTPESPGDW